MAPRPSQDLLHSNTELPVKSGRRLSYDNPDANIDKFMYEFNKRFSLKVSKQAKRMNRIWGGRYKWSLIKERGHYCNVVKYVYLNPVEANIVSNVETYIYSTLHNHYKGLDFPLKLKPYIDPKSPSFINWLKEGHTQIQNNSMNSGLKKTTFNFAGTRESRKPPKFDSYG